jgi:hypothetical protein
MAIILLAALLATAMKMTRQMIVECAVRPLEVRSNYG